MDREVATPVISPAKPTRRELCRAKVRPAKAPVNSTRASFIPSTMEPRYPSRSSSMSSISADSCSVSSATILPSSGSSWATAE